MKSNIYNMHLIAFVDVRFTFNPTYNVEFNGNGHIFYRLWPIIFDSKSLELHSLVQNQSTEYRLLTIPTFLIVIQIHFLYQMIKKFWKKYDAIRERNNSFLIINIFSFGVMPRLLFVV